MAEEAVNVSVVEHEPTEGAEIIKSDNAFGDYFEQKAAEADADYTPPAEDGDGEVSVEDVMEAVEDTDSYDEEETAEEEAEVEVDESEEDAEDEEPESDEPIDPFDLLEEAGIDPVKDLTFDV